jgi:hypothetical protein
MARSTSRLSFWLRWLVVPVLAGVGLLASVFLAVREENEKIQSTAPTVAAPTPTPPQTKGPAGTFPPAFGDARPDLSQSADHVDVCGVGRVRARSDGQPDLSETVTSTEQLIEAAAIKLASSGSDYDRAVALYAESITAARRASKEGATAPNIDTLREQMARFAVGSRDAGAYALAFYLCGGPSATRSAGGTCRQISTAQWALIDADNAVPWLYEAGFALQRQDSRALDAALLRASQARVLRMYQEAPLRLIDSTALRSATPAAAMAAAEQLVGVSAAIPAPNLQLISQYCAANARGAAERSQVCNDLAELLTTRSTALIGMRLGAVVGQRAGWSSEKLAAVRKRASDLQQAQARAVDRKDRYSCGAIERGLGYLSAVAKYGEVAALEKRLSATATEGTPARAIK